MENLIYGIYPPFRLKLFEALLLVMFFTVSAFAQGTGDSVFALNASEPKTEDHAAANYALNQFLIGLMKQYPCVDQLSDSDLAALIGLERMKELLGAEREGGQKLEDRLQEIAGAVGARYAVTFKATTLPNGQTVISAIIFDGLTGQMIINKLEQSGGGKSILQTAESVAKSLLQDLSGTLKNKCEPHWTGTITYTYLIQTSTTTENQKGSSETKSKNLSAAANIVLQPMTLGFNGKFSTQARVTQNYSYLDEFSWTQTAEIPCREPGRNTYYKKVTGDFKNIRTESGSGEEVVSVSVTFFEDGRYAVSAGKIKPLKTKVRLEKSGNPAECRPTPFSTAGENEDSKNFVNIDLKGQVDPKNPDVLTGKIVEGDLETGQKTWEWKLRLVRPNQKRALK